MTNKSVRKHLHNSESGLKEKDGVIEGEAEAAVEARVE
jgi:hypothetical protein